eukprot:gene44843-59855_t
MDNQWLPFTPNRSFANDPRILVAADGMHFTTHDGRQVLDGISSLWCVGAGHNRKPINEAIKKQLDTLDYSTAFSVSNDKAFRAAEMIAATSAVYVQAYEAITGQTFAPDLSGDAVLDRVRTALQPYFV